MTDRSGENSLWKPAILSILGVGLILSGTWTAPGGCGGNTIGIEKNLSSDELPNQATITQYEGLNPDFQTAFKNAVEELNNSRTHPPKTFQFRSTPVDSGDYIQYENRYYKVFVMHGDCGMPHAVVLTVIPGVGLLSIAVVWFLLQAS